jgi:hypothetical protein
VGTLVVLLLLPLFSWRMQQPNPEKKTDCIIAKDECVSPLTRADLGERKHYGH